MRKDEKAITLEAGKDDPLMKQIDEIHTAILKATPEQLGQMQEIFHLMGISEIVQVRA